MKKILALVLAICITVSMFGTSAFAAETPAEPDYTWYGDGTAATYDLNDLGDLLGFANIVNGKAENIAKDSFASKTVNLNANIDLTGVIWTPIGSSMYNHTATEDTTKKFEGTYNGHNHTVTGLSSDGYTVLAEDVGSGEHSFGLFGYAYGANIKNVKLADVDIYCHDTPVAGGGTAAGSGVAALIGYYVPKDGVPSVVENCHVLSGTVIASNNMGGMIGFLQVHGNNVGMDVTVKDCSNAATVTTKAREAGGVFGMAQFGTNSQGTIGAL